jgi:hypothetical protein
VGWYAIVTAHVAGALTCTLDVAQATIAAGTACVIYVDEYDLATDLGLFIDGLWYPDGRFVPLKTEEFIRDAYSPPQGDSSPAYFARIGRRRIKLSHYSNAVRRVEYTYTAQQDDPSGATTLSLPSYWRPALAELALSILMGDKFDKREKDTLLRAERLIETCLIYERRRTAGLQTFSPVRYTGAYGS